MINTVDNIRFFLLIVLLVSCGSKENRTQEKPPSLEQEVEKAWFTDFEGDTVRVSDFKGKVVMVDFWETWCKPCISSFPTMQKLQETYGDDFVVLAVTPGFTDTQKDAEQFARENEYDFHYLMDTDGLHRRLGVQGIPFKIFVDADGNFIRHMMGSYGKEEDFKEIEKIITNHTAVSGPA